MPSHTHTHTQICTHEYTLNHLITSLPHQPTLYPGLHVAALFGRTNMIKQLLGMPTDTPSDHSTDHRPTDHTVPLDGGDLVANVNTTNALGQTPLHCAAHSGFGDSVELLLGVPGCQTGTSKGRLEVKGGWSYVSHVQVTGGWRYVSHVQYVQDNDAPITSQPASQRAHPFTNPLVRPHAP